MAHIYKGKGIFKPLNTGWTDDFAFAFCHIDKVCNAWRKTQTPVDPTAPENGYDESNDTREKVHAGYLPKAFEL